MKIVEGNSYVCIKEWKDTNGRLVHVGAKCYATKSGTLTGYNAEGTYSNIEPLDNYEEYFTLYKEASYNKENRELRDRYAGLAMQAIISSSDDSVLQHKEDTMKHAIEFADILIGLLRKEV